MIYSQIKFLIIKILYIYTYKNNFNIVEVNFKIKLNISIQYLG